MFVQPARARALVDPACDNRLLTALSGGGWRQIPRRPAPGTADDIVELAWQLLAELIDNGTRRTGDHHSALNALRQCD